MNRKICYSILCSVLVFFATPSNSAGKCEQSSPVEELVEVQLANPSITGPEMRIPKPYLHDQFLKLVKKNLRGGRQKRIWVSVSYPNMCSLNTNGDKRQLGGYATTPIISAAKNPHVHRFWNSANNHPWFPRRASSEFGIDEYHPRPDTPTLKLLRERVFYFEGDDDLAPVIIKCPIGPEETVLCRAFTEMGPNIGLQIKFHKALMAEWRTVIRDITRFVGRLVVQS